MPLAAKLSSRLFLASTNKQVESGHWKWARIAFGNPHPSDFFMTKHFWSKSSARMQAR
jgi:hypothetical protein